MEPNDKELMLQMTPNLAGIQPLTPDVQAKLVALLDSIITANAGRTFVVMALNVVRVIVLGLPTTAV